MPSEYTGDGSGVTARQDTVILCPIDSDAPNANSVNVPFQALANHLDFLMQNAGLTGVANTFNPIQTFNNGIHCGGSRITGVVAPIYDSDADTRGARNEALALTAWTNLSVGPKWNIVSTPMYKRHPTTGLVYIRGQVQANQTVNNGDLVCSLPAEIQFSGGSFPVMRSQGGGPAISAVYVDTTIRSAFGLSTSDTLSLDGIVYCTL